MKKRHGFPLVSFFLIEDKITSESINHHKYKAFVWPYTLSFLVKRTGEEGEKKRGGFKRELCGGCWGWIGRKEKEDREVEVGGSKEGEAAKKDTEEEK